MQLSKRIVFTLAFCLVLPACATEPASSQSNNGETAKVETEEQKILYALGLALARNLSPFKLDEDELALVQQGIQDGVTGSEPQVDLAEYGPKLQGFAQERAKLVADAEKAEAATFVEQEAAKEGAVQTESGLVITEITPGDGPSPAAEDTVRVHYHGTLRDGTVFDSSVDRGEPATFPLNRVVPCWTEALQRMKVGGKSRLVCPPDLAYGDRGAPPAIPAGAALVFEVELLGIEAPEGGEGAGGADTGG